MKKLIFILIFIFLFQSHLFSEEKEILKKINNDKGVVMLKTPLKNWDKILGLIKKEDIDPSIHEKLKLEKWPHITLLYGLDDEAEPMVIEYLKGLTEPVKYNVTNVSLFEARAFDIVKFGIMSEELNEFNRQLKKFPYISSYGGYVPHMTIAFVKKGEGKKYTREFTVPLEFYADEIVYKTSAGKIMEFKIKHDENINSEVSVRNISVSELLTKKEKTNVKK